MYTIEMVDHYPLTTSTLALPEASGLRTYLRTTLGFMGTVLGF